MRHALALRSLPIIACLALVRIASGQGATPTAEEVLAAAPAAMKTITAGDLEKHLTVIASDAFEGRLTATAGQVKAAEYIARHFEKCGLKPLGDATGSGERGWTQGYDVQLTVVTPESGLAGADGKPLHRHGAWFLPRGRRGQPPEPLAIDAPLQWCGRVVKGDLDGKDLSGVIPVAVVEMDTTQDDKATVMSAMFTGSQRELGKVRAAAAELGKAGARAAVIVSKDFNIPFLVAANLTTIYPGKPFVARPGHREDAMMAEMAQKPRIPVLILDGADAAGLLAAFGLEAAALAPDAAVPASTPAAPAGRLALAVRIENAQATNVAGWIPGSDPALKDEAVVYSAHMDHVGMGADGKPFNGADDDGSGTCSLLELAEAWAALPAEERPKRSAIFLAVSGEELGLWGSAHYAENPTWPIEKIVADINIDMIGRSTEKVPEDAIAVTPTFKHRAYSSLARDAAFLSRGFGMDLKDGDRFYERSDHYNFAEKDVPVVFFCDDEHADYHLPTDDVAKIEFAKMEKVVRLAFLLGHRTADRPDRPETIGAHTDWFGEKAAPKRRRRGQAGEEEPKPTGEGKGR